MNGAHMNVPISSLNSAVYFLHAHEVDGRTHWVKAQRRVLFEFCESDRFCLY